MDDAAQANNADARLSFLFQDTHHEDFMNENNNNDDDDYCDEGVSERLKNLFGTASPAAGAPIPKCDVNIKAEYEDGAGEDVENNVEYEKYCYDEILDYGEDDEEDDGEGDEGEEIDESLLYDNDNSSSRDDAACHATQSSFCTSKTNGSFVEESRLCLEPCTHCPETRASCAKIQKPTDIDKAHNSFIVDIKQFCVSFILLNACVIYIMLYYYIYLCLLIV